jgi:alkanesulfonate monooxygenase SsuD/methylene tetrahydromethanopterin reductase-like flavin-dependent oxidoreductase (luciferase family)
VAEDAATLDGLSGGRIELALGLGAEVLAFAGFGVSTRGRGDRLEEGITLVRAAFTGEAVTFAGTHHTVSGVPVSPRPVQRPGPPLWLGASADTAVRRAARLDVGLLAASPEAIRLFLAERRPLHAVVSPARMGLERDAAVATSDAGRRALRALVLEAHGADCFDLVVSAEAESAGDWLARDVLEELLALRDELRSVGAA